MRIIPTARLYRTSWRWLFRLMSFYRGKLSVRIPSFELFGISLELWGLLNQVLTPPLLFLSVSRPDKVFFPPANWKVTKSYGVEQDVGPAVEHIYEVISHVLSCADSLGLSRLGWKADLTVHKASRLPRAAMKENQRKRTPDHTV